MKRLLWSSIMVTGLLVAAGGAWAVPLVVDSFDVSASASATGVGVTTVGPQGLGSSSQLPGATRTATVDNALDVGTTSATINIPPFVGSLNINTGNASDGRAQLHYQFGATDLTAGIIDPRLRIELLTLNVYLTAVLTVCSGGPFGAGTCYTDKYDKPAPSDPGYHTTATSTVNKTITGPDEADHFLLTGTGPGGTANFTDRAILTTLDLISLTTCMDPTGTAGAGQGCPGIQHDFDAGNGGAIGAAQIHPVLMSATDIYLTIGIDTRPAFLQSNTNSIDAEIGCLEVVGVGDGPPTAAAPGFPNGKVTVPSACTAVVPEPATLSLMGLGLAALGVGAVLKRRVRKV